MFKANLEGMAAVEEKLNTSYRKLIACADELDQVRSALRQFSYMDEAIWQLERKRREVRNESVQMKQFAVTLNNIQKYYRAADRNAEDYCEDRRRSKRRDSGFYTVFDEKYKNLWNNLYTLLK